MSKKRFTVVLLGLLVLITGCLSTQTTQWLHPDTVLDVGDKWNDTDSKRVAEEMIGDALSRPWLRQHQEDNNGKNPVVVIGKITSWCREYVNTHIFIDYLQAALTQSGEVTFVENKGADAYIQDKQESTVFHDSGETAKQAAGGADADYQLLGEVNSVTNLQGESYIKFYLVNLSLVNIETNEKIWIGEKKIKKMLTRS